MNILKQQRSLGKLGYLELATKVKTIFVFHILFIDFFYLCSEILYFWGLRVKPAMTGFRLLVRTVK